LINAARDLRKRAGVFLDSIDPTDAQGRKARGRGSDQANLLISFE